jgi:hypothetical protein
MSRSLNGGASVNAASTRPDTAAGSSVTAEITPRKGSTPLPAAEARRMLQYTLVTPVQKSAYKRAISAAIPAASLIPRAEAAAAPSRAATLPVTYRERSTRSARSPTVLSSSTEAPATTATMQEPQEVQISDPHEASF